MRRKKGFALLEVLIFIIILLVLSSSILASAANAHRRTVERTEADRAYHVALTVAKILAQDAMENPGLHQGAYADTPFTLQREGQAGGLDVTASSTGEVTKDGVTTVTFTVTAAVGDATQHVSMTLQKLPPDVVPSVPFGTGFAGRLAGDTWLDLEADSDLYLYGYPADSTVALSGRTVGGNLAVQGAALSLTDSAVAGMVITNGDATLQNCRLGPAAYGGSVSSKRRLSGVYAWGGTLALAHGTAIQGDVYAQNVSLDGLVELDGDLYCAGDKQQVQFSVLGRDGEEHLTSERRPLDLSRLGQLRFTGAHTWRTLTDFDDVLGGGLKLFRPNFPAGETIGFPAVGLPADLAGRDTLTRAVVDSDATLAIPRQDTNLGGLHLTVKSGVTLTLTQCEAFGGDYGLTRAGVFVELEDGAKLVLEGRKTFYAYIYGQGPDAASVTATGGAVLYGTIQGAELEVTGTDPDTDVFAIRHVDPVDLAYRAPASGGSSEESWAIIDYTKQAG